MKCAALRRPSSPTHLAPSLTTLSPPRRRVCKDSDREARTAAGPGAMCGQPRDVWDLGQGGRVQEKPWLHGALIGAEEVQSRAPQGDPFCPVVWRRRCRGAGDGSFLSGGHDGAQLGSTRSCHHPPVTPTAAPPPSCSWAATRARARAGGHVATARCARRGMRRASPPTGKRAAISPSPRQSSRGCWASVQEWVYRRASEPGRLLRLY